MKIEKINDNQLKIIISRTELLRRNIEIDELVNDSSKINSLLTDMMDIVINEFDFKIANSTIVVEAAAATDDDFVLLVTRMGGQTTNDLDSAIHMLTDLLQTRARPKPKPPKILKKPQDKCCFSFDTLDDCILCCNRLLGIFEGESFLAKKNGIYYLALNNTQPIDRPPMAYLEALLAEYGTKCPVSPVFEERLMEHGEVILQNYATIKLAQDI